MKSLTNSILLAGFMSAAIFSPLTFAASTPFTVTANLTGDPRLGNPDGLNIDVTIDVTGNLAKWTVDLNMAGVHDNASLDGFFFNLATAVNGNVDFSGFDPIGWTVTSSNNAQGSGGMDFMFESLDPPQQTNNVTNTVPLIFNSTLIDGSDWLYTYFTGAALSSSSDAVLGSGQLGAHIRSLTVAQGSGLSDSGYALGIYDEEVPDEDIDLPEPDSLALLGIGLLGMTGSFRKNRRG